MRIVLINTGKIPVYHYGGTERIVWYLGKELVRQGHKVEFLVAPGSSCDFARVIPLDLRRGIAGQIPPDTDLVHFFYMPPDIDEVKLPYVVTVGGNSKRNTFDKNTIFVSKKHASLFGSESFVYNGLDWEDFDPPDLAAPRTYFHFLAKAAWRVKNVRGAIEVVRRTRGERLRVMGGTRLNIKMGFRFTLSARVRFYGMVGGAKKYRLINGSKGLIFPVTWHEPFGIAIIESLYYGCPVFGTPYGSLPELVPPEVGFLSNHAGELARALENSHGYSRERCHEYARDHFNVQKMAQSYLTRYEKVLNGETLNADYPSLQLSEIDHLEWISGREGEQ